jgi:hypothetical protein
VTVQDDDDDDETGDCSGREGKSTDKRSNLQY